MSYSTTVLTSKLQRLINTQQSIQTLSHWVVYHSKYANDTVEIWRQEMVAASKLPNSASRMLVLLYLANDVIQTSRKRGDQFVEAFSKVLKEAIGLTAAKARVEDQKTLQALQRILAVWKERSIFSQSFLDSLLIAGGCASKVSTLSHSSAPPVRGKSDANGISTKLSEKQELGPKSSNEPDFLTTSLSVSDSIANHPIFKFLAELEEASVMDDIVQERVDTASGAALYPGLIELKGRLEADLGRRTQLIAALESLLHMQEATMQTNASRLAELLQRIEMMDKEKNGVSGASTIETRKDGVKESSEEEYMDRIKRQRHS